MAWNIIHPETAARFQEGGVKATKEPFRAIHVPQLAINRQNPNQGMKLSIAVWMSHQVYIHTYILCTSIHTYMHAYMQTHIHTHIHMLMHMAMYTSC